MAELDLGTLRGHVDLDIDAFDRKYGEVDNLLTSLERRDIPELKVDADITGADKRIDEIQQTLRSVDGESSEVVVTGDASKAESQIGSAESALNRIDGETADMTVDADVSPAESAFKDLEREASRSGDSSGRGMMSGVLAGLVSIPIVGAVVGIGQAIGDGLLDGVRDALSVEATRDLFSAQTGLDESTAARFARAAGNAYADAFGESVEANLATASHSLQVGLIDSSTTSREIEALLAQLDVAGTIIEDDAERIATAVGVMLNNGIADNAEQAFDVLVRGQQSGVNASEDLIDTFTEYPALFARLGLDAETSLGLLNQALEGGARNSDLAADALKEFQIRATDASELSAGAFEQLGFNAEEMTAKIARGGPEAREGLNQVLDGLRAMEDPVARNATGVALFGTQWEDLGSALLNMDPSSAVESLGQVEGATSRAMDALGGNAASKIESAQRNIEIAADGIKGALASAFSDEISGAAEWVAANRAPVMEFFLGVANMALDTAQSFVESAATGTEAFGDFVGTTGPSVMGMIGAIIDGLDSIPFVDLGDAKTEFEDLRKGAEDMFAAVDDGTEVTADWMRTELGGSLDDVQTKMNEWAAPEIMAAKVHDAVTRMSGRVEELGEVIDSAEGTVTINGETLTAEEALESLVGRIDEETGEVTINGVTVPAEEALDTLMGAIASSEDNVTISATRVPADEALSALMAAVRDSRDDVTIGGNKMPADEALNILMASVRRSSDNVTIGGNGYPAYSVLGELMGAVRNGRENVTIGGNDYPADQVLNQLLGQVQASGASITVSADTSAAINSINEVINMASAAPGTVIRPGQTGRYAAGGPIIGPGTGTSDDVPIMGSNGEHMWTAAEVNAAGGHGAIFALRNAVLDGGLKAMHLAAGGPVTTSREYAAAPAEAYMGTASAGHVTQVIHNWRIHSQADPIAISHEIARRQRMQSV